MANLIQEHQNEEFQLRLLASQRRLYGRAKFVLAVQLLLVVLAPGIFLILESYGSGIKPWTALAGLLIAILDASLFEPIKARLQNDAARFQEYFDCIVLELDWPNLKAQKPDPEEVKANSDRYSDPVLRNWYGRGIEEVSLSAGRIICQRSNCWWDAKLRRRYRNILWCVAAVLILSLVVYGVAQNLSLSDLIISLFAPVMPTVLWAVREARQQAEAADRIDRLKDFGLEVWQLALTRHLDEHTAYLKSRILQDEILDHRRRSPVLFDWFYNLLRGKLESQMQFGISEMVAEAKKAGMSQPSTCS